MEYIKFSELTNVGELSSSAIVAIVQNQGGELVSLKCSVAQVAQLIASGIEFQGLTTEDDSIIGAINELVAKVDDLELFKFPNVTIIGAPTINHGQISGFTSADFLKFPFLVDFHGQPFEINMAFTTGANVTNQENIFDSDYGLAFAIRSGHFVIAISTNGTTWDLGEGVGTYTVLPNTTYYVRLSWDGSSYKLAYSLDGSAYTDDITKAGTSQPYPRQIYIGVGENFASVVNHFAGTINLNKADLRIAGEVVWLGMDDAGLSTRADVSLSNIDAAGEDKIKEVMADEIDPLKDFDGLVNNDMYENTDLTPYQSIGGWKLRLDNTGFSVADNGYKLVKYQINAGDTYMVKGAEIYQFQQNASVPASPPSQKVGDQSADPIFTAPNVRYLIVSAPVTTTVTLTKINNKIKAELSQLELTVDEVKLLTNPVDKITSTLPDSSVSNNIWMCIYNVECKPNTLTEFELYARFGQNATGFRYIRHSDVQANVGDTQTGTPNQFNVQGTFGTPAVSKIQTGLFTKNYVRNTTNSVIKVSIWAFQDSGSTLTCTPRITTKEYIIK